MSEKDQNNHNPSSQAPGANPDPIQQHYDDAFDGITNNYNNTVEHPKGDKETSAVADNERKAESPNELPFNDDEKNLPEYSYYKGVQEEKSQLARMKYAFTNASKLKKSGGVGGILGVILLIIAFFTLLSSFQLIHLADSLNLKLDAQTKRITARRAALHYKLALDGTYFEKTGFRGRLSKGYSSLDPAALKSDLKSKGFDVSLDSQGKVTINGEILDGKVKSQRLRMAEVLDSAYPQDGFMKRYTRTKTAFKAMGIKRVFFENTKQGVRNWELEMISRLRQRLGVDASIRVSGVGVGDANDTAAEAEANQMRTDLADPTYDPKPINPGDTADLANDFDIKSGLGAGLKGVSLLGVAETLCDAKYYLKGVELASIVVRHRALIAHTGSFLVAAHQLKTGEGVNGAQLGALMSILNRKPGIGASGSYQLLSGNKDATVKHTDELALSFRNSGGFGGGLSALNEIVDNSVEKIPVPIDDYCKASRNILYQAGSVTAGVALLIAGTVGTPFTGGASGGAVAAKLAGQVAFAGTIEAAKQLAQPYLVRNMAGPAAVINYGKEQNGDFLTDALIGGKMAMSSGERYQAGMTQALDTAQVAEIENTIALENKEQLKNSSVYTKYFALGNVDSRLSKQLAVLPSTPKAATQAAALNITTLPKQFITALGFFTPQGKARAADAVEGNPYITQNPLGIEMYGMEDATIDKINDNYDVAENEEWIYDSPEGIDGYTQWANECYPADDPSMLYGMALDEDKQNTLQEKCIIKSDEKVALATTDTMSDAGYTEVAASSSTEQEKYERYATYRLDRGIQQSILFQSKTTDCMDPDNEDWDCPFVDENTSANGANDVSVDPQSIEYREFNLTKILEKYNTPADFVGTLDAGDTLNYNASSCDNSWDNETINSIKTPIEWNKSSHFCWPSSVKGKGWTPQGISGSSSTSAYPAVNGRNILLTSWYSLEDESGYVQSRRSDENNTAQAEVNKLVAVDADSQKYEEIELVVPCSDDTAKLCALGIHAGGVGWLGEKVIVAYGFGFYSFDLNNLRKDGDNYILPSSGKWKGSALGLDEKNILISSSMSVDKGAKQIISAGWNQSEPLKIYRWNLNSTGTNFESEIRNISVNHEFSTAVGVQGVASDNGITFANSSNADGEDGGIGGALYYWPSFQTGNATGRRMPSGVVEGLYIDNQRDKIWSLTEHGIQYVFSFPLSSTVGSIGSPSDEKVPAVTVNPTISTASSGVSFVDGEYAWPVDIPYKYVGANNERANIDWECNTTAKGCHHNGEPAFDLFDDRARDDSSQDGLTVGKAVFAITSGKMEQSHIYKDISGCYSFHIIGDDGFDYYYTHTKNPIISGSGQVKTVKVGEKVAEIGERKCTDPNNTSLPHLHIERAKKGLTVTGDNPISYRDPILEDIIVELHNRLPK